ncbi:hypothetical protein E4U17_005857 [Claviceps sp. LM77 group G4]|nr:hypothetical protein E4U17_005857 [Claviceps sp. LM77 group G4]KAG6072131.1 hypothetical protein E4U33_003358 [Claviceps sp. LM78 group G4]KAG6081828.1 hypothetical protein E4U16_006921 [Claviceps sp. LM84 group G4]
MSYYDNPQWPAPTQNNWEHQGTPAPTRPGASGPQSQDDYAYSYQFDEVDRAYENLQKSGKGYAMSARRKTTPKSSVRNSAPAFPDGRPPQGNGPRAHPLHNNSIGNSSGSGNGNHTAPSNHNNFDGPPGHNLHNFYASQRHQPSRGSNEAEQVIQAKRRMAAQRERELRNLHTEQQYQRNALTDLPQQSNKHMSEEETRELIARQRSALYGEGPFAEKTTYVDETGKIRTVGACPSGSSSIRGPSPLAFDSIGHAPSGADAATSGSVSDPNLATGQPSPRAQSTSSPQSSGPPNKAFDNAVGPHSRTSNSSPTAGGSPPRDFAPGSKGGPSGASVAPIGTRPSGTPSSTGSGKRSTPPLAGSGNWSRGNAVWGQPSGLGAQASVWG